MKRGNRLNTRRRIGNDNQRGGARRRTTMFKGRRDGGSNRSYRGGRNAGFRDAGRRRGGNGSGYRGRGNAMRDNNRRRIPIRKRLGKRKPMNAEQLDNDLDNYHKKQGEGNNYKDYLDNDLDSYRREGESKMNGSNNNNKNEEDKKE